MITLATMVADRPWGMQANLLSLMSQTYDGPLIYNIYDNGDVPCYKDEIVVKYLEMLTCYRKNFEVNIKVVEKQPVDFIRQQALDECKSSRILYVDSDVYMNPFIVDVVRHLIFKHEAGYIQPCIQDANALGYQNGDPEIISNPETVDDYNRPYKIYNDYFELYPHYWMDSACVCFDAEILRSVGGFKDWAEKFGTMIGSDVWVARKMKLNNTPGILINDYAWHNILQGSRYYTEFKIKRDLIDNGLEHLIHDIKMAVDFREIINSAIARGEFDYLYEKN